MMSATRAAALGCSALFLAAGAALAAQPADQVDVTVLANAKVSMDGPPPNMNFGGPIPGIDGVVNFTGSFHAVGANLAGTALQFTWHWSMVGNSPTAGGTTAIDAPIIAVDIKLLDEDGEQRYVNGHRLYVDPDSKIENVLHSPVFSNSSFTSSTEPTQWTDAVQRAEFWSSETQDWHTLLVPHVKEHRVMSIPKGSYRFALNADGSCCRFVLVDETAFVNLLFPPTFPVDNTTVMGAAELAGDITTKTVATFLFRDIYLYKNGDPNQCCVLGFHSFDFEPGATASDLPRAYMMNYSSWISPGLFKGGFQDVAALSHEMAELFNDPFVGFDGVHNITPWWLSGAPGNQQCAPVMEDGDVIEVLPNPTFTVATDEFTYHLQNVALLQWFEFKRHPDSLGGAYSYPDASLLPRLSVPQQAGCKGPLHFDD